jgi:two-component system OmpR family sensor kinase
MNKNSIFLKINIIFAVATISVFLFLIFSIFKANMDYRKEFFIKLKDIPSVISSKSSNFLLKRYNLKAISSKDEIIKILTTAKRVDDKFFAFIKPPFDREHHHDLIHHKKHSKPTVLEYNSSKYIFLEDKNLLFKDLSSVSYLKTYTIFLILIFLVVVYIYLLRSLKPLKILYKEIKRFSNGEFDIDLRTNGKDELSLISNEFHNAISSIKNLQQTRRLFLRNIMHELKTPITKGKLIAELSSDDEYKEILNSIFFKLEAIIKEMSSIEQVTSKNFALNRKDYRLIDLIDNSCEMLFLDLNRVNCSFDNSKVINCDFRLMSLVFKNLIDNAIKHSTKNDLRVKFDNKKVIFINSSTELKKDFNLYLEPFFKDGLDSSGLGLGLYIINEILKLHHYSLNYNYSCGKSYFIVNLEKTTY